MVVEIFHWLWLAILLGAAVALWSSADWRRGVARHTSLLAGATVVAVAVEIAWRFLASATVLPVASWAAACFFLSLALSTLDQRRGAETPAGADETGGQEELEEAPYAEDPFRSPPVGLPGSPAPSPSAETRPQLALVQTADAVAVMDLEGNVEWVNPAWARLHGYGTGEVSGHHVSLFHTPEQVKKEVRPRFDEAREAGFWQGEAGHRRKDGSRFSTQMSLSLLRDGEEAPWGYVAIARPPRGPREEIRAESPLREGRGEEASVLDLQQEIETVRVLTGSVAHELNNLLTGIMGNASLIHQGSPLSDSEDEVREIEAAARRAAELSRLLQAYTGKSHPTVENLDVSDLVRSFAEGFEEMLRGHCSLSYELSRDLPSISVDPAQVRLLLRNLLANARDATRPGEGGMTIRTGVASLGREELENLLMGDRRAPGNYVFLEIEDQGTGLGEEARARMFDPFYTTRPGRRGLGLTAAAGIVRTHHGLIGVEGEPNRGTRVRAWFPAGERPRPGEKPRPVVPPPVRREKNKATPAAEGNGTILVVDNERVIRDLATSVLRPRGFSVLTASDGAPALDLFHHHLDDIRLVLLDLSMPLMDGEEVFRRIRRIDPEARVILMTGHDAGEVWKSFRGKGLAGVVQKPFKPEDLLAALRGVLG